MSNIAQFIPHGYCLSWQPKLMLLHIGADLLTALAYSTIPLVLLQFTRRRKDLQFRWIFILFGVFIMACGLTHLMSIWTLWFPDYLADGLLKAFTALASIGTALALWRLLPKAVALPGPAQWTRVHEDLRAQIAAQELGASVFNNAINGIAVVDAEARLLSINPAFTRITGYTAAEAVGRHLAMLNSEVHSAEYYLQLWESIVREGKWSGQLCSKNKRGDIFYQSLNVSRVTAAGDEPVRYVCIFADVTEEHRLLESISYQAYHDPLTGLANRARLREQLELALAQRGRQAGKVGLMFIDLDHFKPINDALGHDVGDTVLTVVADRLTRQTRPGDVAARVGGDEFVLLLRDMADATVLQATMERLMASLGTPIEVGKHRLLIGASVGLACAPDDGVSAEALMRHADTAMYAAKQRNKSRAAPAPAASRQRFR
jgi:diguanylate cyclase (GGDEF)-like protein/PAS domain S-box-containing protein